MATAEQTEAAAKAGHNIEHLEKTLPKEVKEITKLFDAMESDMGSHRKKIKDRYDTAASNTGLTKRAIMREVSRARRRQKERAEELEMKEAEREEIEAIRATMAGTPMGDMFAGQLAQRIA